MRVGQIQTANHLPALQHWPEWSRRSFSANFLPCTSLQGLPVSWMTHNCPKLEKYLFPGISGCIFVPCTVGPGESLCPEGSEYLWQRGMGSQKCVVRGGFWSVPFHVSTKNLYLWIFTQCALCATIFLNPSKIETLSHYLVLIMASPFSNLGPKRSSKRKNMKLSGRPTTSMPNAPYN